MAWRGQVSVLRRRTVIWGKESNSPMLGDQAPYAGVAPVFQGVIAGDIPLMGLGAEPKNMPVAARGEINIIRYRHFVWEKQQSIGIHLYDRVHLAMPASFSVTHVLPH